MEIAILLFNGITALDAVGPYEVLSRLPDARVRFVAAEPGPQRADSGFLTLTAVDALSDVTTPDIVVIPGGPGTRDLLADTTVLDWIRGVHKNSQWTTSVCTGALLLAAAGILKDEPATTHWNARETLRALGAQPIPTRVVRAGKVITAAGVSAGIDMAIQLARHVAGDEIAQALQLVIEYDPQPPFNIGALERAPARIIALASELLRREQPAGPGFPVESAGPHHRGATGSAQTAAL